MLDTCETEGVRSRNNNVFVYNAYWGTWSRVLHQGTLRDGKQTVEVNLTPVNPQVAFPWEEQVRPIVIRVHSTANYRGDKFVGTLPADVVRMMKNWLNDNALFDRLLHEDFLPHIDFDKYREHCNGGAAFHLICK